MLRIRMQRLGRRNRPYYRIVLTDARVKRQGEYKENLGHYDPRGEDDKKLVVNVDRVKHWVGHGAQVSESVASLIKKQLAAK
ncbi:MAG: 30S ribosomal protein S16 [Planctomycetota bacterium]|nr:30S ribosomal protein S16 [Planctomycetota bacterium]